MSEPTSTKEDAIRKKRDEELTGAYKEFGSMMEKMAQERAAKQRSDSDEKGSKKKDKDDDEAKESGGESIRSRWASWKNRKGMRQAHSRAVSQKRPYSGLYNRPQAEE